MVSCMVMIMLHYLVMVQGMFVDKQRNAAVVLGDRDLKKDVKDKKKRFYALPKPKLNHQLNLNST